MPPRLLLLFVLLSGAAHAGWIGLGDPDTLRPTRQSQSFQLSGAIRGFKLTDRHGREVHVPLPRPLPLDAPLSLPAGDWADITLTLDGPVTLRGSGGAEAQLPLESLTASLEDPDARLIRLEWTLPEALLDQLRDGRAPEAALTVALQDGALGRALTRDGAR